jgi:glycosyltransferase involved in cell wall biosynthesis
MMSRIVWAIVTGEYPPQRGGVADYTQQVARALAAAGDDVHIYAPACPLAPVIDEGVTVHRLPGAFGVRGLATLGRELGRLPGHIVLVQYVPQSFGLRGCNIPFAYWLRTLRRGPLWVMFHEVTVTVDERTSLKYRIQARATDQMARLVIGATDVAFISTTLWKTLLGRFTARLPETEWVPVPSNIATSVAIEDVARVRTRVASDPCVPIVGHFGTYREAWTRATLLEVLPSVLSADERSRLLLLGNNGDAFAADLKARHPALAARVTATGNLDAQELADHIAACTVLVQPYESGVTTRRGSVTAGLALGVPTVTTEGPTTESLWRASGAVALCGPSASDLIDCTNAMLSDPAAREDVGRRARELYAARFDVGHTVDALRRRALVSRGSAAALEPLNTLREPAL